MVHVAPETKCPGPKSVSRVESARVEWGVTRVDPTSRSSDSALTARDSTWSVPGAVLT